MRSSAFIALAALLLTGPALACAGPNAQISGDFQTGEKGWGEADAQFQPKGSEAVFTPLVSTQTARWNAGVALTDLDTCATIAMPSTTADATRSYAGILFWGVDKDNFYQAVIAPNGMFTVARKVQGRILPTPPVNWLQTSALKLGSNEKNTLRVTIDGQLVTVRINDTEVASFRGQAPDQASHVGLVASSAPAAVDTWTISDFKVTDIAAPAQPAAAAPTVAPPAAPAGEVTGAITAAPTDCGAGKVLFDDSFAAHDSSWGGKDGQFAISGGEAVFTPAPGTPAMRWNRAFVFGDIDACAKVELAKATRDPTQSYAGLLFWVQDGRNYYQAVIAPNGYFTVARIVDGKVVAKRPVDWKKLDSIKTGAEEKNTLRVTAKGPEVKIAVNGKTAASFTGEPPRSPSYLGMMAASADTKKGDSWSVSDLKVTAPQ
jgi:hypothetical protein